MAMSAKQLIAAAAACTECGKEHKLRRTGPSWSTFATRDGHSYKPVLHTMTGMAAGPVLWALRELARE